MARIQTRDRRVKPFPTKPTPQENQPRPLLTPEQNHPPGPLAPGGPD